MTKRDFFRVIIKLFGLFQLIIVIFQGVPKFLEITYFSVDIPSFFYGFIILGFTFGVFLLLINRVDKVIEWLNLDAGFDEDRIQFESFNSKQIIKLAIVFLGGLMIVNNLPELLYQTVLAFKNNASTGLDGVFGKNPYSGLDYFTWVVSGLNVVFGYLLLTNYKVVAKWLDTKTTVKINE